MRLRVIAFNKQLDLVYIENVRQRQRNSQGAGTKKFQIDRLRSSDLLLHGS